MKQELLINRLALSDAITFDQSYRAHLTICSLNELTISGRDGEDPLGIRGFSDVAGVLIAVGRAAIVRMGKGLRGRLARCSKAILVDIEQKQDFLQKLQSNLSTFGKRLSDAERRFDQKVSKATSDEQKKEVSQEFILWLLQELDGVTAPINDAAHARNIEVFENEKAKLKDLPEKDFRAVSTFYYNYKIFVNAFARCVQKFNSLERHGNLRIAVESLAELAAHTTTMLEATGDIFSQT